MDVAERREQQLLAAHRRLARALEREGGSSQQLAEHWQLANEPVEYARWAIPAAEAASSNDEYVAATQFLARLLAQWETAGVAEAAGVTHVDLALRCVQALRLSGQSSGAAQLAQQVADGSFGGQRRHRAQARVDLAAALSEAGSAAAGRAATEALDETLLLEDSAESTRLLAMAVGVAATFALTGRVREAAELAWSRAKAWQLDDVTANVGNTLGCLMAATDPDASRAAFRDSGVVATALADSQPTLLLRHVINAPFGLIVAGRYDEAAAIALEGLTFVSDRGFPVDAGAHLAATAAEALLGDGKIALAQSMVTAWLGRVEGSREQLWLRTLLGRLALLQGDLAQAGAIFAEVDQEAGDHDLPDYLDAAVSTLRAEFAERTRRPSTAARVAVTEAERLMTTTPVTAMALLGLAALSAIRPSDPATWGRIDELWAQITDVHESIREPWILLLTALRAPDNEAQEEQAWQRVESILDDRFAMPWRIRATLANARAAQRCGRPLRTRRLTERADELIRMSGCTGFLNDVTRLRFIEIPPARTPETQHLTPRERQVLKLVARGASNTDIGNTIHVSARTIESHLSHALRKLDATSRSEAVAIAFRLGVINADDLD